MIQIQHTGIYTICWENDTDCGVLISFYTRQDAVDYISFLTEKMLFAGGDVLLRDDVFVSLIDSRDVRWRYWVQENRLTTMDQLERDGRLN
jgi:hypothetical protein